MKKLIYLLVIAITLNCCSHHNDDQPVSEISKLPPATQTGANTAGCLVNGIAFLPKGYVVPGNLVCNYTDGENFSLKISEKIFQGSTQMLRSVIFGSQNQNLHDNVGVSFALGQNNYDGYSKFGTYVINGAFTDDPNYYSTSSTITGEFKITYFNYNQAIISGTFWYDAINSTGQKVEVRNGRFDMHY